MSGLVLNRRRSGEPGKRACFCVVALEAQWRPNGGTYKYDTEHLGESNWI